MFGCDRKFLLDHESDLQDIFSLKRYCCPVKKNGHCVVLTGYFGQGIIQTSHVDCQYFGTSSSCPGLLCSSAKNVDELGHEVLRRLAAKQGNRF